MEGNNPAPPPYTPGPQAYPPGGAQAFPPGRLQAAVIIALPVQATDVVGAPLRDTPAVTVCPSCCQNITTRLVYSAGPLTYLVFGLLCAFVCWLGCCLIPFCVDSCKDVDHFCPNCNYHIYRYNRM